MTPSRNLLFFNLSWFAVAHSTQTGYLLAPLIVAVAYVFIFRENYRKNLIKIVTLFSVGLSFDLLCERLGLLHFSKDLSPISLWLIALWLLFSQAAWQVESVVKNRFLIIVFFAFGGPLSYFYGTKIGLIVIPSSTIWFIQVIFWTLMGVAIGNLKLLTRKQHENF